MKGVFNVKTNSLQEFFRKNVSGCEELNLDVSHGGCGISPYNLMQDEIMVRKGMTHLDEFVFHLRDYGSQSNTTLQHEYTYDVEGYDSVNDRLVLRDFKVTLIDKTK